MQGGAANNAAGGSAPMFFMGNPGDYAWGREGLDSVITQMLNQMENSGPPPMAKDKIQDIQRVEISDEQVAMKLQCSVCWDDFERMESVRKLPCTVRYSKQNTHKTIEEVVRWIKSFKMLFVFPFDLFSIYITKNAFSHGLNCTVRVQFAEKLLIRMQPTNNKIKCLV